MKNLNKVLLIGNATKDPELKYTPSGTAVCSFSVATNRDWKDSTGQMKSEATFHKVIAWSKLAEIISQYLKKGSKVYLEGRITNRQWTDKDGVIHYATEIVADELILLDNKNSVSTEVKPETEIQEPPMTGKPAEPAPNDEDIPF